MFWKRFSQARSAGKLFNEANDYWRRRQTFLLKGDDQSASEACAEVVRLCQLAIQSDERNGDAYVLLANALLSAASEVSTLTNPEQYEFLHSRAAAVIHFWYSLPHRGYPITKNTTIAERLWRIVLDELKENHASSEPEAITLMDSYRDSLAANTISPSSFVEIKRVICARPLTAAFPDGQAFADLGSAEEHCNLGVAYANQGKLDEAIVEYKEALSITPDFAGAYNNLGLAYSNQGKFDDAITEYRHALSLNPNYAEAHSNLGLAYANQGNLDEAIREYKEALRIDPNNTEAHSNLGIAYYDQGNFDHAIREYKEALRINPNYAQAHSNLGNAYQALGKLDQAIQECKEALRILPNFAAAHLNLGNAYADQGQFKQAIECYQSFVQLAPPQYADHVRQVEDMIRKLKEGI